MKKVMKQMLSATIAAVTVISALPYSVAAEDFSLKDKKFDDVTIRVATRNGGGSDDAASAYYEQKVKEFNEMDHGITVEMTNISSETDYLDKLSTDFASGDAPNIFQEYGGARLIDYLDAGYLLDLQPYLEADEEWYGGFSDNGWSTCKFEDYGYEGIYGVPSEVYQIMLYYNKELLEKNNVKPPKTMDELMAACAALKDAGVEPFQIGEKDAWRFGHLHTVLSLKKYGSDVAEKLATREMTYDGEEMTAIYDMMKEMVDKGYLGDNLLSTDKSMEDTLFEEGKAAFKYDGSWYPGLLQQSESPLYADEKVGVIRFPAIEEEYATVDMGGATDAYYVSTLNATEEQIEASVVFLKYLASVDYIKGLIEVNPNTYAYNVEVDTGNYLLDDVMAIMEETQDVKSDLQGYDTQSMMMNTVRTSLQGLAMGKTSEEVGKEITDTLSEYE